MLFDQTHPHELLTPMITNNIEGGLGGSCPNPFLSSLDFLLLDDIDSYFPSSIHSKKTKNELLYNNKNDDGSNNNSQQEEFFEDFDFTQLEDFDGNNEKSELINWDIEKYISQSAFPSPPMDTSNSPSCSDDNSSGTIPWIGEECTVPSSVVPSISAPPSPPLSSIGSSPAPIINKVAKTKKRSLTTIDRKLRKKNQNKTAAEKYRIKKKSEKNQIFERHSEVQQINRELKLETENLTFRVQQLKQLFLDLLQIQLPSTLN